MNMTLPDLRTADLASAPKASRQPQPLRLPLLISTVAAATVAALLVLPLNTPSWWAFVGTAAALLLSHVRVVNLPFGRQRWSFAWEEIPVAAALLLAPGAWIVGATALGIAVAQVIRKQPRLKQVFNSVQLPAAACVGVAVALAVDGVLGVVLAMAAFWAANTLQVTLAIWTRTDRRFFEILVDGTPLMALHSATNVSMAILGYWIMTSNPLGLLALIAPGTLMVWAIIDVIARTGETQLLAELVRAHESRVSDATDEVVGALIQVGSRLVPDIEVELIVFTPEGPHLYRRQARGTVACHRMRVGDFAESWALAAATSAPVTRTNDDTTEILLRVGRTGSTALGLVRMVTTRSPGSLGRAEYQVLRMLARHAEASLSIDRAMLGRDDALQRANAAAETVRSLSDISADTAPALRVLRESAGRLATLAAETHGNEVEVTQLVEELYAVERAVASLCGAVTLASIPGVDDDDLSDATRIVGTRGEVWTRTGLLDAAV